MEANFLLHLERNWPLTLAVAIQVAYLPVSLAAGSFYTNQGLIRRSENPEAYWRWIALAMTLLAASAVVLVASFYLGGRRY